MLPRDIEGFYNHTYVVNTTAKSFADLKEFIEPLLSVGGRGAGADEGLVRVGGLQLHPAKGRLLGAQVGLTRVVGLIKAEDRVIIGKGRQLLTIPAPDHGNKLWRLGHRHSVTLGMIQGKGLGAPIVIPRGSSKTRQV